MNLSFEEIKRNTKEQFKRIVKEHVNKKAFKYLRTRMLELRANFKSGKNDLNCRLCNKHEENQQMLLKCSALNADHLSTPPYSDLYSEDADKVTRISMILKKKFEKFEILQVHGQRTTSSQPGAASSINVNDVSHDGDEDMD